jgi:acetyltransferase
MERHLLSPLIDPSHILVWVDDQTPPAVVTALSERLSKAKCPVTYWPQATTERVDLALIAVNPDALMDALTQAASRRCRAAVILTTNVSVALQEQIREEALRLNIAVVGPASFGIQRPGAGLNASVCATTALPGRVALLSQSGALASSILDWAQEYQVGFSAVITLGNEADVDLARALDFLAFDHDTHAIVVYLECVAHPRAFLSALRAAAGVKPVIVLKAGATTHAPTDPLTHTQALVGSDEVFDAAIRRAGAVRVRYFIQLFAAVRVLTSNRPPNGARLAVVSNGRGPALLVQDLVRELNIKLVELPDHNPLIVRADANGERYANAIQTLGKMSNVDCILVIHSPQVSADTWQVTRAVAEAAAQVETLVIGCWLGDHSTREPRNWLSRQGVPSFRTPEAVVDAFNTLSTFRQNQELLQQVPPALSLEIEPDLDGARMIIEGALAERRNALSEMESKSLLSAFGIPVSTTVNARHANEAALIAHQIGFPVVLKINSPDIPHKSEVGGVRLNLKSAHEVRDAFAELTARVKELAPTARIDGVVVQRFIERTRATEAHIGMTTDPLFGPVISFGPGGERIRWVRDRALELPPLNGILAQRLIERTQLGEKLIEEMPGGVNAHVIKQLETTLLQVSNLICELPALQEIDINPVIISEEGVIIVDARMIVAPATGARPPRYSHLSIMPYPGYLTAEYPLNTGGSYEIRAIRWDDGEKLQSLLAHMSDESRFMRFIANIKQFTPRQLARFTQIDYHRDMALAAVVGQGDSEKIVGVARYMLLPQPSSAEFALVVQDDFQNHGIGSKLMTSLFEVAKSQQLAHIEGYVLGQNPAMLKLMSRLGFQIEPDPDDPAMRRVVKRLAS